MNAVITFKKDRTEIIKELKEPIESLKVVANIFKDYYEKLEYTNFSGSHPYETELLLKHLKHVNTEKITTKHISAIGNSAIDLDKPTNSKQFIDHIISYYSAMMNNYYKLFEIYIIFDNYQIETSAGSFISSATSMSRKYVEDILKAFTHINSTWEHQETFIQSNYMEQFLSEFILKIMEMSDINTRIKLLEHIKEFYNTALKKSQGLNIVDLYSIVLDRILSEVETNTNKPVIKYIIELIEELKDNSLPMVPRATTNRINTIQKLLQRHKLISDGMSRPLADVVNELTGVNISKKTGKVQDILSSVAKIAKYGFIVISKRTSNPIEHNMQLLTDMNYLQKNKLLADNDAGVNDVILTRSHTITYLENTKGGLADGIYKIGEAPSYYILETLDGTNYHVLFPWYISIFVQKKKYDIPASQLPDLLNMKKHPSTRLESYNYILNAEIIAALKQPPIDEKLSRLAKKQKDFQWGIVRKKIVRTMLEGYKNIFDENKVNKTTIDSLILNQDIFDNALRYIVHTIGDSAGKKSPHFYTELYLSALSNLFTLKKDMITDTEEIYRNEYKDKVDKILTSAVTVKTTFKLLDVMEIILMQMLETHITKKSNVYLAVQEKIKLLELLE